MIPFKKYCTKGKYGQQLPLKFHIVSLEFVTNMHDIIIKNKCKLCKHLMFKLVAACDLIRIIFTVLFGALLLRIRVFCHQMR